MTNGDELVARAADLVPALKERAAATQKHSLSEQYGRVRAGLGADRGLV